MINAIHLLRNIGQFDSVASGTNIPLQRLTLVYAENGRGKTTLAAILRSLATGDAIPIAERKRLAAQHPPQVVLDCIGGPPHAMFQNNAWNRTLPAMLTFDDCFIDNNVYSGLVVGPIHRQNLHELILGAQGVALSKKLQKLAAEIEAHNTELRTRSAAIPSTDRGTLSVDDYCALPARDDIDEAIQAAERNLAAIRQLDSVRNTPIFSEISLPSVDAVAINAILQRDLPALNASTATLLEQHFAHLGDDGELWVAAGMRKIPAAADGAQACPFCAQDLAASPLITHYGAYFGEAYKRLKEGIADTTAGITRTHGGDSQAGFERSIRVAIERHQFWSRFCDVPEIPIDTAAIARDWRAAREAILSALRAKQSAPLDRLAISTEGQRALVAYETHRQAIVVLNQHLQRANEAINVAKEQAAVGNAVVIEADVARLKAVKSRHTPTMAPLCANYLTEKAAKRATEEARDQAKSALDKYRETAFPGYQTSINLYLEKFNAGFRLGSVTSTLTRGGPACTYNVLINNTPVPVTGAPDVPGEPSFRTTLSAGDRNTLALAFFFASLDQDPTLSNTTVVIDDPISSLDEHRSLTTVQQVRRLAAAASQVIILSHNKPFLCRLWEGTDPTLRAAITIARDGAGSTLRTWDVDQDCVTEHDRRHALLRDYQVNGTANSREVARAIRPLLEAFLRVACPEHFPPGTLLGPFRGLCEQRAGTGQEILTQQDTQELRDLVEYANRFHHDTNPAWETEAINDGELSGFVNRAIRFAKR